MSIEEVYKIAGGDFLEVEKRLISVEFVTKFLIRFLSDDSYASLEESVAKRDVKCAFRHAHTLKGVAKNLGLNDLGDSASKLTELLRSGTSDGADVLFEQVKIDYNKVVATISEYVKDLNI